MNERADQSTTEAGKVRAALLQWDDWFYGGDLPEDACGRGAIFSQSRLFRYALWRRWDDGPMLMFLMLNPSTADLYQNDPTVERCERRARKFGYPGIIVCNLFALVSTDPTALKKETDPSIPVGELNDPYIRRFARGAEDVICGWGEWGRLHGRGDAVLALLREKGIEPLCLRENRSGHPAHPLYIAYDQMPYILTR